MELKDIIKKIKNEKSKKFDESIEVVFALTFTKSTDSVLRMDLNMPNHFGKEKKVLVLCDKNEEKDAVKADFIGLDEYVEKIKTGWKDFDVVIATPTVMPKIAILGKYLGSSGLMPNPKSGTVTKELEKAIAEFKSGKTNVKTNKQGQIQLAAGKKSMDADKLIENIEYVIKSVTTNLGSNFNNVTKSVYIKSSMGKSYRLL